MSDTFPRIPFKEFVSKLTSADTEFLRNVFREPTGRAVVIELYKKGQILKGMVLPTSDIVATDIPDYLIKFKKSILDAAPKDITAKNISRRMEDEVDRLTRDNNIHIKDVSLFFYAFIPLVKLLLGRNDRSESPDSLTSLFKMLQGASASSDFLRFVRDGRSISDNKYSRPEYLMPYAMFDYFERCERILPKGVRIQLEKPGTGKWFIIKDVSYYSTVDTAAVKSKVDEQLAKIFSTPHAG